MPAEIAAALTVVRVPHGDPPPGDAELRSAIEQDRVRLHLPPHNHLHDLAVAGPYTISIDGRELDEYVVWEH